MEFPSSESEELVDDSEVDIHDLVLLGHLGFMGGQWYNSSRGFVNKLYNLDGLPHLKWKILKHVLPVEGADASSHPRFLDSVKCQQHGTLDKDGETAWLGDVHHEMAEF